MENENFETGEQPQNDDGKQPRGWNWGVQTRFGKQPQPSNEAKRAGWAKKKRNKKLAKYLLNLTYVGETGEGIAEDKKLRSKLRKYFGLTLAESKDLTNEAAIMLRQIANAIESGDQASAQAIMERAYGKVPTGVIGELDEDEDQTGKGPQLNVQVMYVGNKAEDTPQIKENETDEPV